MTETQLTGLPGGTNTTPATSQKRAPTLPTKREENIIGLLRNYDLATAHRREGISSDTGAVPGLPHSDRCLIRRHGLRCSCWLKSVAELERCLRTQRVEKRELWYAVWARYIEAQRRPITITVHHGKAVIPPHTEIIGLIRREDLNRRGDGTTRVLAEQWSSTVRLERVTLGVTWIADRFNGQPELPIELLATA